MSFHSCTHGPTDDRTLRLGTVEFTIAVARMRLFQAALWRQGCTSASSSSVGSTCKAALWRQGCTCLKQLCRQHLQGSTVEARLHLPPTAHR
eukprot:scaffold164239_cov19-Tisochrysis_lutea.AAC.1